jgi:glycosyltransferase involved in cell wall biosynthesis
MNIDPMVSIVVPCFNDGRFLGDAIESAEANLSGNCEIIIVNDGSTDARTLELLKTIESRGHQVIHQENRGLGFSRNVGIGAARGTYILPLDADNRIRPAYIDRGIEILGRESAIDVVYGDAEYFGEKSGRWFVPDFSLSQMLTFNFIDACAVIRKSAWERCGGYDENMPVQGYEDWDFWLRVALTGGQFYHLQEVLFDYHVRSGSMSSEMGKRENTRAAIRHIYAKRLSLTIGTCADVAQSWDPIVEFARRSPLRCLARLVRLAWFDRSGKFLSVR